MAKPRADGCACQPILRVWVRHREELARERGAGNPPPAPPKSQPKAMALLVGREGLKPPRSPKSRTIPKSSPELSLGYRSRAGLSWDPRSPQAASPSLPDRMITAQSPQSHVFPPIHSDRQKIAPNISSHLAPTSPHLVKARDLRHNSPPPCHHLFPSTHPMIS